MAQGCPEIVGVRNISLSFTDCDGGDGAVSIRARTHTMSKDELPMYNMATYTLEGLSRGRAKRTYTNATIELPIVRDLAIPLIYYQGRAAISVQIEHINGVVVAASNGIVTGVEASDGNDVRMNLEFAKIEELLPSGALV
jgi:hypothetical protein